VLVGPAVVLALAKTVESKETRSGGGGAPSPSNYDWGRRMLGSLRRKKPKPEAARPASSAECEAERPPEAASPLVGSPRSEHQRIMREDFLRATMRIFLVVSPPMGGRMQVHLKWLHVCHRDAFVNMYIWGNSDFSKDISDDAGSFKN